MSIEHDRIEDALGGREAILSAGVERIAKHGDGSLVLKSGDIARDASPPGSFIISISGSSFAPGSFQVIARKRHDLFDDSIPMAGSAADHEEFMDGISPASLPVALKRISGGLVCLELSAVAPLGP